MPFMIETGDDAATRQERGGWVSLTLTEADVAKLVEKRLSNPEIVGTLLLSRQTVATTSRTFAEARSTLGQTSPASQPCGPPHRSDRDRGDPQGGFAPAILAQGRAPDPVLAGRFRDAPDPSLVLTLRVC